MAGSNAMTPSDSEMEAPAMRTVVAAEAGGEGMAVAGESGGEWPWRAIAGLAWLGVACLLVGAMLWQTLRFARQVHAGRLVTSSDALDLLEECRVRLGVGAYLALVETEGVRSPALLGCIRPKLLVPRGFLDSLSREEIRHVFLHELAHVKRGDIWSSWAINLLTAMHWFNPLIWFARRRFIADREAACDAHVLAALDVPGQRSYGHTVLNLMQRFNTAGWTPGIAGISEYNSNLKRRIVMIKHFRTPSRLAAWVGAGLCVGLGLVTLTNAQERVDLDTLRQEAAALAEEGRYTEAIELLAEGRAQSEAVRDEFSGLIVRYKLSGDISLSAEEREYVLGELDARRATRKGQNEKDIRSDVPPALTGQTYLLARYREQLDRLEALQSRNEKDPDAPIDEFRIEELASQSPRVVALEAELNRLVAAEVKHRATHLETHPERSALVGQIDELREEIENELATARSDALKSLIEAHEMGMRRLGGRPRNGNSEARHSEAVDDDALWPIALWKSGLLGKIGSIEEAMLRAQEQQLSVRQLEVLEDYIKELEETRAARPANLLRPAADAGGPDHGRRYPMKNGDDDWVYFQSMETGEGPKLLLERGGGVDTVPAARDSVLISYLANGSYSAHQQLSVSLNDKIRVLIVFNLPEATEQGPLERAVLRLELRQSGKPTAAPFAMAVHRATEPWDNSTSWHTQPKFDAKPSIVVAVPPEPGTVDIDVTELVNGWLTGDMPNHGLVLRVEEPFYGPLLLEAASSNGLFSDAETREMPIDEMFQYLVYARVGYHKISARLALAERAKLDSESHSAIIGEATRRLRVATWGYERWSCAMLLGTIGDVESVAPLAESLKSDPVPGVREGASIALGLIDTPEARAALEAASAAEEHQRVGRAIRHAQEGAYHVERGEVGSSMNEVGSAAAAFGQTGGRWVQRLSVREAQQLDSGEVIPSSSAAFYQWESDEVVDN